ncbi:poly [ADP-ribose] polymerase [Lutzomyia longipalpis]|uniref:poly [ADP-ribose] polymerase n=1 Tax=Lutzomyia longipalpis TaxID=7200 RepID=UPI002483CFF8|nr:poly [ADP-ribose] polymerase [Lutzomyia longipalpis]
MELPYLTEYAKSSRASCRKCKGKIEKGELRLAVMVQSAFHDSKQPNWFHSTCFFEKQRPASEGDISGFASLRTEDQDFISKEIAKLNGPGTSGTSGKGKGKKRGAENTLLKDFGVEYSKSDRATCCGCQQKILKAEVRIKKVVYDTEIGMKFGGQPLWHHVECFAKCRGELMYFTTGDQLPGFNTLSKEDKAAVKKALPAVKEADMPVTVKKAKVEKEDEDDKATKEKIKKQNDKYFKLHRLLEDSKMTKNHFWEILEHNKQDTQEGKDASLNLVCDILTFGALERCTECKGQLVFSDNGYKCTGSISEWSKCLNVVKEPKRFKAKIPQHIVENFGLEKVKPKVETRAIKYHAVSAAVAQSMVKKENGNDEADGPKVTREKGKLYNMEFFLMGRLTRSKDDIRAALRPFGGRVGSRLHENTMAVIATENEVEKMSSRMEQVKELKIQVIPESFLDEIATIDVFNYITSNSLCDWGADPSTRVKAEEAKSKSKSIYEKSVPKSLMVRLKNGSAVDPDSGLEDVAHVYKENGRHWTCVLSKTDVSTSKNSYYKLQLLQADNAKQYWVYRAWGRIGTTIGDRKISNYRDLESAKEEFEDQYFDKTDNMWGLRGKFVKQAGKYYELDIEYGDSKTDKMSMESSVPSKLQPQVQDLIKLIFDIDAMKKVMLEYELDMDKMPLGKLSEKQIRSAYGVLTELSQLIEKGGSNAKFVDATNRFFTLIPHNFGVRSPPLLDKAEEIQSKIAMLDSLLEIEVAYSLLKADTVSGVNPVDTHYEQLKTNLEVLDKESEEFALLSKYVKNTHAATHNLYELEIEEIFKVKRNGEDRRYKPFKKLHNRRLLWHGSRTTNYAGILSHGLKIAPPEAPVTGYMFGKGIYFADMVSKSANYCCTSSANNTGLMLLCEVALGDMQEFTNANYVTKLPTGKHSVKGIGKSFPDPKQSYMRDDGVEIPLGTAIEDKKLKKTSLLYNEFIVYDAAQVNIQYLFKMKFKYQF